MKVLQDRIRVNRNQGLNVCLMFDWYIRIRVFLLQTEEGLDEYLITYVDCSETFGFNIFNKRESNVRPRTLTDGDGRMGEWKVEG